MQWSRIKHLIIVSHRARIQIQISNLTCRKKFKIELFENSLFQQLTICGALWLGGICPAFNDHNAMMERSTYTHTHTRASNDTQNAAYCLIIPLAPTNRQWRRRTNRKQLSRSAGWRLRQLQHVKFQYTTPSVPCNFCISLHPYILRTLNNYQVQLCFNSRLHDRQQGVRGKGLAAIASNIFIQQTTN